MRIGRNSIGERMQTGGVVKMSEVHRLGDESCSPCPPLPDFRIDVEPVFTGMTTEEIEKEIMNSLRMTVKARIEGLL